MKFDKIDSRFEKKKLSCKEALEMLGVSLRTFYGKRQRYKEEGCPFDRRMGKTSPS